MDGEDDTHVAYDYLAELGSIESVGTGTPPRLGRWDSAEAALRIGSTCGTMALSGR